jgi:hypothetical protein
LCRRAKLDLPITACGTAGAIKQFDFHGSLYRHRKVCSLQRGDDRALLHWLLFVCTFCDQLIECLGHGFHRPNFVFDLQLFLDRPRSNVAAAGLVAPAQLKQLADFGKCKAAALGVLDKMNAPSS